LQPDDGFRNKLKHVAYIQSLFIGRLMHLSDFKNAR